jgi:hypothetical protein
MFLVIDRDTDYYDNHGDRYVDAVGGVKDVD